MAIIREITFADGKVVRITDWGDYPLYSRGVWARTDLNNMTDTHLFKYTVGDQMPAIRNTATAADTNMPAGGHLPMGHQMLVYSIQVIPDEFADVINNDYKANHITPEWYVKAAYTKWKKIFHQTMLNLKVEQTKSFVSGRLDHFPAGGGFLVDHNSLVDDYLSPYAAGYKVNNGQRTWAATRRLAMPVHLGSLENFECVLSWPRGQNLERTQLHNRFEEGFGLTVRLTGPRQRPTG